MRPICGSTCEIDKLPTEPIKAKANAPPLGNRSAVTPSIVGQKKAIPRPKIVA